MRNGSVSSPCSELSINKSLSLTIGYVGEVCFNITIALIMLMHILNYAVNHQVMECSESNNIAVSIVQYWFNAERVDEWHTMWSDYSFL